MTQYLITAYDHTDEGALQRRMDVRPHHLDALKEFKAKGNLILAGAILNDEGKMIGSSVVVQFETEEELEAWKLAEPYYSQGVWETVDVKLIRVANV